MTNRRRNLIVLVLVLALLAASAWVICDKRTVQGLDLRGGTELVYQGRATPQVPEVKPRGHRSGDRDHPRARRHARRRRARDHPDRARPDRGRAARRPGLRARDRADRDHGAALLLRLGEERHPAEPGHRRPGGAALQPADRRGRGGVEAQAALRRAVREAGLHDQRAPPTTSSTPTRSSRSASPPRSQVRPLHPLRRRAAAELARDRGPAGDGGGRGAAGGRPEHRGRRGERAPARSSSSSTTLRRCRATRSRTPKPGSDPTTNQPNVTFDFTEEGREAFQKVTREIALRGADACAGGRADRGDDRRRTPRRSSPTASRSCSTARSSRARSSTSRRTRTGSTAAPGPRSPATSRPSRPRTWPRCCGSARCRSSSR